MPRRYWTTSPLLCAMTSNRDAPTLLLLAAGMGSRYGGLKQMDSIGPNGETLMDYSIFDAYRAGFKRVVFLIREEIRDAFEEKVGAKYSHGIKVEYAYQKLDDLPSGFACPEERIRPWGTGHAVWAARSVIGNHSFAVINADDYYGKETFLRLIEFFSEDKPAKERINCAMIGFMLDQTLSEHGSVSRGICSIKNGFLEKVEEWTQIQGHPPAGVNAAGKNKVLTGKEMVSMNVWAFSPEIFSLLESDFRLFLQVFGESSKDEFYLPSAVDSWIRNKSVVAHALQATCSWMGVTYKEDRPRVVESIRRLVSEGVYPSPLL